MTLFKRRWETAQTYEKRYWKQIADKIAADAENQLTWYGWKAGELEKKLANVSLYFDRESCRVLEVGSGPIGIVGYLKWGEKYAIDPLNDYYMENPSLVALRTNSVSYITGKGEDLPFPDGHFQIAIIDNVLDHVLTPDSVLNEIHRVLSPEGTLYIELNIHTYWGYLLHSALAKLRIDKGHPYSFTDRKINELLRYHGFDINLEVMNDYFQARQEDMTSSSLKRKLKGYIGLTEFIYHAICNKRNTKELAK